MNWDDLIRQLQEKGYGIVPDLFPPAVCEPLRSHLLELEKGGVLRQAGMGPKSAGWQDTKVRGDEIFWWEESDLHPAQRPVWELWKQAREQINQKLFLGVQSIEAHYAHYPPGQSYARHQDRFATSTTGARVISFVGYLNENWTPADGGELWLYADAQSTEPLERLLPKAGTAVFFLSEMPHEVRPATRDRRSIAGWFKQNLYPG